MSRNFHSRVAFVSMLVFVFLTGAVGKSAPPKDDPPDNAGQSSVVEYTYSILVTPPKGPFCKGDDYYFTVKSATTSLIRWSDGSREILPAHPESGMRINSKSSRPDVGTISPDSRVTT